MSLGRRRRRRPAFRVICQTAPLDALVPKGTVKRSTRRCGCVVDDARVDELRPSVSRDAPLRWGSRWADVCEVIRLHGCAHKKKRGDIDDNHDCYGFYDVHLRRLLTDHRLFATWHRVNSVWSQESIQRKNPETSAPRAPSDIEVSGIEKGPGFFAALRMTQR